MAAANQLAADTQATLDSVTADAEQLASLLGLNYVVGNGDNLETRLDAGELDLLTQVQQAGGVRVLLAQRAEVEALEAEIARLQEALNGAQGNVYQVSYNAGGRGYTVNGGANGEQTNAVNIVGGAGNGTAGSVNAGNGLTIQGGSGLGANAGLESGVFMNGNKVADYNGEGAPLGT